MKTKKCSHCLISKQTNQFRVAKDLKNGLSMWCWKCIYGHDRYILHNIGQRDRTRMKVRERDNHTCQRCGKVWIEGQRRFDVHHLDETMLGKTRSKEILKYDKENMDKLITFCHKCHFEWHVEHGHNVGGKKLSPVTFDVSS